MIINKRKLVIVGTLRVKMDLLTHLGSVCEIVFFYYIDTSVLLENIPLVKFIKTTSGTQVVYFP